MKWFRKLWSWVFDRTPDLVLRWHEGDTPPNDIKPRELVIAREGDEFWAAAFLCPCKCGERIELALFPEAKPSWKLTNAASKSPTLYPSVWRKVGCKSHFWVRDGKIKWCR
ncbi:MAG: DUF6527 family protein [Pseudomonadota bacterium]